MTSVLFVCLGNICRSPTAEAVMRAIAQRHDAEITIDSAGTIGYHQGNPPDRRAVAAGESRGYSFDQIRSRPVEDDDFHRFDLILAADRQNLADLKAICPTEQQHKLKLILDFAESDYQEVPDPYYGGSQGFELVLDLLEEACQGVLRGIKD